MIATPIEETRPDLLEYLSRPSDRFNVGLIDRIRIPDSIEEIDARRHGLLPQVRQLVERGDIRVSYDQGQSLFVLTEDCSERLGMVRKPGWYNVPAGSSDVSLAYNTEEGRIVEEPEWC